eukprot:scaffold18529_cov127-Isochrysis_galbana.AAC.3
MLAVCCVARGARRTRVTRHPYACMRAPPTTLPVSPDDAWLAMLLFQWTRRSPVVYFGDVRA